MPVDGARRRLPAVRPRARAPVVADLPGAARRSLATPVTTRCSRCSARRTSPRAGRCSSSTTAIVSRAPCAAPSRPTPRCSRCPTAARRSASRSTATAAASPPTPTRGTIEAVLECAANLACVGAEPLGADQLPELRQPREAAHRLAAHRVGARAGRRLPRAGRAGRRRQRLALQRGRRRARSTRRRSSAWSASCPTRRARPGSGFARAGDAIALAGGSASRRWPRASWRSCAASRCPTGCPTIDVARGAPRCTRRSATRCAPGALCSCHDVAEGGLAVALAECCLAGGVGAALDLGRGTRSSCSASARAGFVVSGAREALERALRRRARRVRRRSAATRFRSARTTGRSPGSAANTAGWPPCSHKSFVRESIGRACVRAGACRAASLTSLPPRAL